MATRAEKTAAAIAERIERAQETLKQYSGGQYSAEVPKQYYWPVDLITDLHHLCDTQDWDWDIVLEASRRHYAAEVAGEDELDDEPEA